MKVAVVGSGCSGLAATWLLNEFSSHEVHLFEAEDRPGGHANTVNYKRPGQPNAPDIDVDTGFIVLNPPSYPNFLGFLNWASIDCVPTEMTFSISRNRGEFEWAGDNLRTLFCQFMNIFKLDMWRLVYDIIRFNACCRRLLINVDHGKYTDMSIGEYVSSEGYSSSFIDNYLMPMTACVWSTPPDVCFHDFPALTLIKFLNNHHLLQLTGKPKWLTVAGGSHKYVRRIISKLPKSCLHLSSAVAEVSNVDRPNGAQGVKLRTIEGHSEEFDHVILACHSDSALQLLRAAGSIQALEDQILSSFRWNQNKAVLHCDTQLMPRRRLAWSCWNFLTQSENDVSGKPKANADAVALTYSMNLLQHISEDKYGPVLVTLNPPFPPDAAKTVGNYSYAHPIVSREAVQAQKDMVMIQNKRGISYAGAYLGYGFHEDGFTSGLSVAVSHLGVKPPFPLRHPDRDPGSLLPALFMDLLEKTGATTVMFLILRVVLRFCQVVIRIFQL